MSHGAVYELSAPTGWAKPPNVFSYSSLKSIRSCPRRWLLLNSAWGDAAKFPQRYAPSAVEGRIVHDALDRLARSLGRAGSPAIGSEAFAQAVESCRFWEFFVEQVSEWNEQITGGQRRSTVSLIRTKPMDLANRAIRLLREQYDPDKSIQSASALGASARPANRSKSSLSSLLAATGTLTERELRHPSLPLVGILDLIRATEDGIVVVDFKTGAIRPEHKEQVELYGLLWWRNSDEMPVRVAVQYLNARKEWPVTREGLERLEATLEETVSDAANSLQEPPGEARPSSECSSCLVRARCNEGWTFAQTFRQRPGGPASDVEAVVASAATATGYLIKSTDGTEVPVVFEASIGNTLPKIECGDRVRIIGAFRRDSGELELTRSSELYRL